MVEFIARRTISVESLRQVMDDGSCDAVGEEQVALGRRYADDRRVMGALDEVWIKIVRRVPVRTAPDSSGRDP